MGENRVIKRFIAQGQGANLQKAKELFAREAQQLYQLSHPQIPKLYAYFQQDNLLFLVQEFVAGENLLRELSRQGKFPPEKIVILLQELLPVLDYLHSQNVLHRDIKPENIMRPCDGKLILIDFGGAKVVTETVQNQTGTALYTPGYAANEQMRGKPTPASDIYSLGVTCLRLLTGCLPRNSSNGNHEDSLYDDHKECWRWREELQRQGRSVSQQLGEILDKMVEPTPINRFQSAQKVLKVLNTSPKTLLQPNAIGNSPLPSPTVISTPPKTPSATQIVNPLKRFQFEIVTLEVKKPGLFRQETEIREHRSRGQAEYFSANLGDGVTLEMVAVPGGKFMMGTDDQEIERLCKKNNRNREWFYYKDRKWFRREEPQHEVTIQPFFLGKYPVTQAQWRKIASRTDLKVERDLEPEPSHFKGDNKPVEQVSWYDAVEFCARLSKLTGREYRLPSEAEWEYACRAGTTTLFYFGETITGELANYDANYTYADEPKGEYREQTTLVGRFPPNAFGLYDMHGNVWEWCLDNWHDNYKGAPTDGSAWLINDNDDKVHKVLRGGSWDALPENCRSALRVFIIPRARTSFSLNGFRVVCGFGKTL